LNYGKGQFGLPGLNRRIKAADPAKGVRCTFSISRQSRGTELPRMPCACEVAMSEEVSMRETARSYDLPWNVKLPEKVALISFVSFLAAVTLAWVSFLAWLLWACISWLLG
jgi:hypothetical protein